MRKYKKIIGLGLVMALCVATFAGCGSKEDTGSTADAKTFVIGGSGPLTGDSASYGNSVKNGAQTAIDEINEAGGVNGIKLQLKFEDDEAGAQQAQSAYNKLMDEGVNAILGTVTSASCLAIIDGTHEDGILQVTPSGSAVDCTKYDNAFRICFTDPVQGTSMADYAIDELGYKNFAVIYNVADAYSKGIYEAFKKEVTTKGGKLVAEESFNTGDVDFNTQLTTIKNAGADAIFIPAYYQDVAYILKQAKKQGIDLPFLGSDGWDGVINQLKDEADVAEGAIFLSQFVSTESADNVQSFVKSYKDKFGNTPDQFAADGYDGVYAIRNAIEKAGSTKSADLIKAMKEITVDGVTGKMTFDQNGEPNKAAKFIEIKDGQYTLKKQ